MFAVVKPLTKNKKKGDFLINDIERRGQPIFAGKFFKDIIIRIKT